MNAEHYRWMLSGTPRQKLLAHLERLEFQRQRVVIEEATIRRILDANPALRKFVTGSQLAPPIGSKLALVVDNTKQRPCRSEGPSAA